MADVTRVPITDDWHQAEPMAYAVKSYEHLRCGSGREYEIFHDYHSARVYASQQEIAAMNTEHYTDWIIYPLYASHGVEWRQPIPLLKVPRG